MGAVANTALSESVIRFVAIYSVKNDWKNVSKVLMTSCYLLCLLLMVFLLFIYGVSYYLLPFVVANKFLLLARSILPFGLLAFWINGVASAFLSFFEGMRLAYIKNTVIAICVVIFYMGSRYLVPIYGLIGVVYAQILQSMVLFVVSAALVYIKSPYFSFKPLSLKSDLFKEIMAFSVNIQIVSVITIFYEPVTKYFLARFGNISFVGFYEMGNRLVLQARSLIISATQVLVPNMTIEAERSAQALNDIYKKVFSIVSAISTYMLAGIVIFLPYISTLWIGHFEPIFIRATIILGVSWYINILVSPVYFVNYATNSLKINLAGQIVMGALNPLLCFVLGMMGGSYYVIVGWGTALACGSLYTMIKSHKKYKISNWDIFKPEIKCVIINTAFMIAAWLLYWQLAGHYNIFLPAALAFILFCILGASTILINKNMAFVTNAIKIKFKQPL